MTVPLRLADCLEAMRQFTDKLQRETDDPQPVRQNCVFCDCEVQPWTCRGSHTPDCQWQWAKGTEFEGYVFPKAPCSTPVGAVK